MKHCLLEHVIRAWYQHRERLCERALLQQRGEFVELISSVSPLLHQVHGMEDKLGGDIRGARR